MKINSTRATGPVGRAKGKKAVRGASFSPTSQPDIQSAQTLIGTAQISSVDALVALQAEPEVQSVVERATGRANSLLGILDTIRIGLLEGGVPEPSLKRLLHALGEQREETGDPKLEAILEQVEIRAQVELAKLELANK